MQRCAIYARFSSDRQSENSADDQVSDCRRYAEREGWTVTSVFTDLAISGTRNDRPGMTRMRAQIAAGAFDVVLVEDLDRLARDQEDIAGLYKRATFAGARIFTIASGEVNELHIGLKGTMDALELKKIAEKVRRGQRGAVARGKIPGGIAYGYDAVRSFDAKGEPERGLRVINPGQAAIVVRIFREYADGKSPKVICRDLNADVIASPRGGDWLVSAIVGNRARATGILHNPLYRGAIVYNRTRWVRDPETRNRLPRINDIGDRATIDVPHLRIVDQALWDEVQAALDERANDNLQQRRRPRHLLSGLTRCGVCSGAFAIVNSSRLGCSNHANGGRCVNNRTIALSILQKRVLGGLEEQLLSPEAVALLVREYHLARAKQLTVASRDHAGLRRRLAQTEDAVKRLVAAIADGGSAFAEIRDQLTVKAAERHRLQAELSEEEAVPVIALHPQIADAYRLRVRRLIAGLEQGEVTKESAAGQIRALISEVTVSPALAAKGCAIEVVASLGSIVDLATNGRVKKGSAYTAVMVAGVGFEPTTFRL